MSGVAQAKKRRVDLAAGLVAAKGELSQKNKREKIQWKRQKVFGALRNVAIVKNG